MKAIYYGEVNMTKEATSCTHNSGPNNCICWSNLRNGNNLPHNLLNDTMLPLKNPTTAHQQNVFPSPQLQKDLVIQPNSLNHIQNCHDSPRPLNPQLKYQRSHFPEQPLQGSDQNVTMQIQSCHLLHQPGTSANYLQRRPEHRYQPVKCLQSLPVNYDERHRQAIDLQLYKPSSIKMQYQPINYPLASPKIYCTNSCLSVNYQQSSCCLNHHQTCRNHHQTQGPQLKYYSKDSAQNACYRSQLRSRTAFTIQQLLILEKAFKIDCFPSVKRRSQLAKEINLEEKTVKIWFQNRRIKDKKEQYDGSPSFERTVRESDSTSSRNQESSSLKNQEIRIYNTDSQVRGVIYSSKRNQDFVENISKMPLKTVNNNNLILERRDEDLLDDVSIDECLLLSSAAGELIDLGSEIIEDF